jgi:putative ABC transport system permease protein
LFGSGLLGVRSQLKPPTLAPCRDTWDLCPARLATPPGAASGKECRVALTGKEATRGRPRFGQANPKTGQCSAKQDKSHLPSSVQLKDLHSLDMAGKLPEDDHGVSTMNTLLQDVRFGLRMLAKNPGFTAAAVLTLALGIAANTTIFSAVNGWMLRRPRIKEPHRVVVILTTAPAREGWGWDRQPVSAFDFLAWREQSRSFEDMAASERSDFSLTAEGEPERLLGMRVSANYFQVLGVEAALGRTFLPGEDEPSRNQVAILSHGLWQRRFGSNPKVIGETVRLNGESYTVVGVMSSRYRLDVYGGPQLWTPLVLPPESILPAARGSRSLEVMARLKPGISIETAKAEMAGLAQRSEQAYPGTSKGWGATAISIQHFIADEFGIGMMLQMGVVLCVLLIACFNIASLQLARGAERQRELAVRAALGASRFRLVRQLFVESLLMALAGGGLGLLVGWWGVDLFRRGISSMGDIGSIAHEVTIDQNVLIFTLGISVFAAALFGLAPAIHQTALDLHSTLKEGGRASSQSKTRHRTQSVLVTTEIALALVLLTAAGVFVQEFLDRAHAGFGIDPNHVLTANISLSSASYKDPSRQAAFFQEATRRLEALPGVISAGATSAQLMGEYGRTVTFSVEGRPALSRAERARSDYFAISPDYLRTLRIPLIRGRNFSTSDSAQAPPVALVNQEFVRRSFPNEEPIGKHIRLDSGDSDRSGWSEIVGVVGNIRTSYFQRKDMPQAYEPYLQQPSSAMTLVVRTKSDPAAFATMLRGAVWSVDKDQPITRVLTMNQVIAGSGTAGRVVDIIFGTFAVLGLALAAVGVFGVMAYTVAQRTHEIGIRMALGAQRTDVMRMVVKKGAVLGAIGTGIGLALAVPLVWLKLGMVNDELLPFDQRGPVFVVAVFVIWLAALLASYIPARRATKVDPLVALRYE